MTPSVNTPEIVERKLADLCPYEANARKHSAKQLDSLREGIRQFGFNSVLAIWQNNIILAGHARWEAAQAEGIETARCLDLSYLTLTEARAFVLSDNRISDMAGWDDELLKSELEALEGADDLSFPMESIGFDTSQLAKYLPDYDIPAERRQAKSETASAAPYPGELTVPQQDEIQALPPVTVEGDLWACGDHRIFCGDSREQENLKALMGSDEADLYITDPPYGLDVGKKLAALRKAKGDNYESNTDDLAGDDLAGQNLTEFLKPAFAAAEAVMKPGAAYYIFSSGSNLNRDVQNGIEAGGLPLRHGLIWRKNNFILARSDYNYDHEPFWYGWKEGAHSFYGPKNETTVWECNKPMASRLHPSMKPVELIERAIRNSSRAGDIVLDSFGGSGTTMMACENRGRATLKDLEQERAAKAA